MSDWTPERAAAHNARVADGKKVVTKFPVYHVKIAELYPRQEIITIVSASTTAEEKLNKTEKRYLSYLRALGVLCLNIQAITLRLGHDLRFTPDFSYSDPNGKLTLVDVKGGHTWEDSRIKIKTAATQFREFAFIVATWKNGSWHHETIKP